MGLRWDIETLTLKIANELKRSCGIEEYSNWGLATLDTFDYNKRMRENIIPDPFKMCYCLILQPFFIWH